MKFSWCHEAPSPHAAQKYVARKPLGVYHKVERDKGFVMQCIASAMRLREPFTTDPFPFLQSGIKPLFVLLNPMRKEVVLFIRRGPSDIAGSR